MPEGRALDAWLGSAIGETVKRSAKGYFHYCQDGKVDKRLPRYTTDIAAAMGLLEAMYTQHEWWWTIRPYDEPWDNTSRQYVCSLWSRDSELDAKADTLPAAIAAACYRALGGEEC